jgi:hypothetical protein
MLCQTWLLLGLVSVGAIAPFLISPAHACTPHPDNPQGCDQINTRLRSPLFQGAVAMATLGFPIALNADGLTSISKNR